MTVIARLLPENPVLTKEMRVRMRGARGYWILFGYLGFLSAVLLFMYAAFLDSAQRYGGHSEIAALGQSMFNWIVLTQMFLVLFITPAITSGALTIEREQRTLDMLAMTRMTPRHIVTGKLLSAVLFTALLLASSLPLISVCFMLGSIDPAMVVSDFLMLLTGSFLIGAMGLMWSSIARTTTQAVLYTFGSLFVLFVSLGIPFGVQMDPSHSSDVSQNLFLALGANLFGDAFLGFHLLPGTGFVVFSVLGGVLLSAITMSRLETWPERRAGLLRGLTTLLIGLELLSVNLWWLRAWYLRGDQVVQTVSQPPIAVLVLSALALLLLIPTFATGELAPKEAREYGKTLRAGWSRQGLKRGNLASGLPFMLLLTLLTLGLYLISFVCVGRMDTFASANFLANFPPIALMLLVTVVGFSQFCRFLSVAFRNRWVAWLLAYVYLIGVFIVPEMSRVSTESGVDAGLGVNLHYLNPIQAIVQMSNPDGYYNNSLIQHGQLLFGSSLWAVTTLAYFLLGGLSLWLTRRFVARIRAEKAAIPHEEMVAA